MSVIINDFEVVVEGPKDAAAKLADAPSPEEALKPALAPMDVEDIIKQRLARRKRLRAH